MHTPPPPPHTAHTLIISGTPTPTPTYGTHTHHIRHTSPHIRHTHDQRAGWWYPGRSIHGLMDTRSREWMLTHDLAGRGSHTHAGGDSYAGAQGQRLLDRKMNEVRPYSNPLRYLGPAFQSSHPAIG